MVDCPDNGPYPWEKPKVDHLTGVTDDYLRRKSDALYADIRQAENNISHWREQLYRVLAEQNRRWQAKQ